MGLYEDVMRDIERGDLSTDTIVAKIRARTGENPADRFPLIGRLAATAKTLYDQGQDNERDADMREREEELVRQAHGTLDVVVALCRVWGGE